ncbi:hypothetical protein JXR93_05660 [bacterium]|nr:hypothetical protein [bacterium]
MRRFLFSIFMIFSLLIFAEGEEKNDLNVFGGSLKEEQTFELELNDLETDVNLLKERVFRSKARLSTLHETLVSGKAIQGAKLSLFHKNDLTHFEIKSVIYHLDGAPLYAKADVDGDLTKEKSIQLYNKIIIPGYHLVSIIVKLEVKGYGVFSYARGYQFQLKASHSFYIEEGKITTVNVSVYEKGGYFSDLTKKPDILFKAGVSKDLSEDEAVKISSDKRVEKKEKAEKENDNEKIEKKDDEKPVEN